MMVWTPSPFQEHNSIIIWTGTWSCLFHVPLQFGCDRICRFLAKPPGKPSWSPQCWQNFHLRPVQFIFLWWVSARARIVVSKAMLENAWGPLRSLDEERGLLLAFSARRPGAHSTIPHSEELHGRKCQYLLQLNCAWSHRAFTAVPKTPSPAPQILNRSPSPQWIYPLNHSH